MRKLEDAMNELTDMDWGWWPFLSLRPPRDQEMDNLLLLKMSLCFGSALGPIAFLFFSLVGLVRPTWEDLLRLLWVGWLVFYVLYKFTFAYFWNRRARRLAASRDPSPVEAPK